MTRRLNASKSIPVYSPVYFPARATSSASSSNCFLIMSSSFTFAGLRECFVDFLRAIS